MKKTRIYTMDLETDPWLHGRFPLPFCGGIYDGNAFVYFWSDDPAELMKQMHEHVMRLEPGIIYLHNGGKFDVYYFMDWLDVDGTDDNANLFIINSRIVKATMRCNQGRHEIRDSFAILPFRLKAYKKDDIDYTKLERNVRNEHRQEIVSYLRGDCVYLWELCNAFVQMFGTKLTVGGTSMGELRKVHTFDCLDADQDAAIRIKYYYGGRVQCFATGVIKGDWKVYDVNSMYPHVMRSCLHPITAPDYYDTEITDDTVFITARGTNHNAFPMRTKDEGLRFNVKYGVFSVTIHEWNVAMRYGLFECDEILETVNYIHRQTFAEFIDKFYTLRNEAKLQKDETHALFYKYIMNSCYGKFAQNPDNYFEYALTDSKTALGSEWSLAYIPNDDFLIWQRPTTEYKRFNVATAASITGAARAVLLEAIAGSQDAVYCDTDSIICKTLSSESKIDDKQLGAWKCEATGTKVAIAGRKLYAVFDGAKCIKQANKGVKLTAQQIMRICEGDEVTYIRDAPSFHLGVKIPEKLNKTSVQFSFVTRRVKMRK